MSNYDPAAAHYDSTRTMPEHLLTGMFERVEALRVRAGDQVELLKVDVRSFPFEDGRFDVGVVSTLFQHVGCWTDAVAELRRVTCHGARSWMCRG